MRSVLVIAIEAEHKKPNGRRQVCALPIFVNAGDKLPQGLAPILRDLSQHSQNVSYRLTLVLWPAMTTERLRIEDFMTVPRGK